jgi:hypothetical protein
MMDMSPSDAKKNMVIGSREARNEELLCWRGPEVIYETGKSDMKAKRTNLFTFICGSFPATAVKIFQAVDHVDVLE